MLVAHSLNLHSRMLAGMNLYSTEIRHAFEKTLAWLNK